MNHKLGKLLAGVSLLLWMSGILSPIDAQALFTENLCGPGTNWISLPSESDIMTAEQLCQAIGPAATSVAKFYPDLTGRYTWDCTGTGTDPCTSSTGIPEASCSSHCFCVHPGEGFEVATSGPASFQINGCDSYVPIDIPLIGGNPPGVAGLRALPHGSRDLERPRHSLSFAIDYPTRADNRVELLHQFLSQL